MVNRKPYLPRKQPSRCSDRVAVISFFVGMALWIGAMGLAFAGGL